MGESYWTVYSLPWWEILCSPRSVRGNSLVIEVCLFGDGFRFPIDVPLIGFTILSCFLRPVSS
jgi:hypothetical protein